MAHHVHPSASKPRRRPRLHRTAVLASVLAIIGSYGVGSSGTALAASLTGSGFEIDTNANLVVDGADPAIDWLTGGSGTAMRAGVHVRADRPTGQEDDAFTQGTDINDTTPTITTGSVPNNKSDLTNFGVYVDRTASDAFINVFWTRVQAPSGTTTMDFEFNQSPDRSNDISPPHVPLSTETIPVRTAGDILISYLLENGGTNPTLTKRVWSGSAWGTPTVFSASDALGSINTTAIPAAASGGLGALDALTFGEASIRLSAFVPSTGACRTFGSAYLRSRSSATDTDENKDFIAPEPVTISNCGSVRIHKTDANGALAGAGFTLYKDAAPVGGARGAGDTVVAGTCTTSASGDCAIADVKLGDYWLVETTVPAGHDPVADQQVAVTAPDQVVSLHLVDPIQTGTIRVTKVGVPPDGTDFSFSLDGNAFLLDDDADGTLPSTRDFTVQVGSHSLSEVSVPTGWSLTGLSCTDPTSNTTTSLPTGTATIDLAKNELVACTFTNSYAPQGVPLTTQVVSAGGGAWDDVATLTGDGTHAVTGTVAFYACSGMQTAAGCAEGGTKVGGNAPVSHVSGSTYRATTTVPLAPSSAGWTCFRAEYTSTSAYYQDASHTNTTTECFLTRNDALTVGTTASPAFGRAYQWTIDKDVDTPRQSIPAGSSATFGYTVSVGHTHTDGAWTVTGTTTVSNPNDVAFTGVDLTQAVTNGGTCTVTNGQDLTVPANGSVQRSYTCTWAAAPAPLTGTSTASAAWDAAAHFTEASTASGSAAVDFGSVQPSTTDESITVTDTVVGALGTVSALTDPNPKAFTYTVTVPGSSGTCTTYPNTAAFLTNDTSSTGTASQSVQVCVAADLTVAPAATGTVDRTYLWTIDKTVDVTTLTLPNGSDGTYAYSVTVRPAGTTDGNPVLGGSLVVSNPNDWQDVVADVAVTADLGGGVTCAVAGGDDAVVPKGGTLPLDIACSFTGVPALTGTLTATVTWDKAAYATPTGQATGSVPVELGVGVETNRTITVVDDKTDPQNPVTLGTATYDDGEAVFTYTLTQSGEPATTDTPVCVDYTNVAGIVETEQTDTQVVTLCHTFTGGGGGIIPPVVNPPQGGGLPTTGDPVGLLVRAAGGLLLAGLVLLLVSRRRRTA